MANRILLGERGSSSGIWISKPGFNVLTTGLNNMSLSSERGSLQGIFANTVTVPNSGAVVTAPMPSIPYVPIVIATVNPSFEAEEGDIGGEYFYYSYSVRYRKLTNTTLQFGISASADYPSTMSISYIVCAREVDG